jgi:hypothetical protein
MLLSNTNSGVTWLSTKLRPALLLSGINVAPRDVVVLRFQDNKKTAPDWFGAAFSCNEIDVTA